MKKWVVYRRNNRPLVAELLSSRGQTFVHIEAVFKHRVRRSDVYGAFSSPEAALKARDAIREEPLEFLLRDAVARLEGHCAL